MHTGMFGTGIATKKLRNIMQVPQHLTHIYNSCIVTNTLTLMSTFKLKIKIPLESRYTYQTQQLYHLRLPHLFHQFLSITNP